MNMILKVLNNIFVTFYHTYIDYDNPKAVCEHKLHTSQSADMITFYGHIQVTCIESDTIVQ